MSVCFAQSAKFSQVYAFCNSETSSQDVQSNAQGFKTANLHCVTRTQEGEGKESGLGDFRHWFDREYADTCAGAIAYIDSALTHEPEDSDQLALHGDSNGKAGNGIWGLVEAMLSKAVAPCPMVTTTTPAQHAQSKQRAAQTKQQSRTAAAAAAAPEQEQQKHKEGSRRE